MLPFFNIFKPTCINDHDYNLEQMEALNVPFWADDLTVLIEKKLLMNYFPTNGMTQNEKLNSLVRFSLYVFLITVVITGQTNIIIFPLITMIFTVYVKYYNPKLIESFDWDSVKSSENVDRPAKVISSNVMESSAIATPEEKDKIREEKKDKQNKLDKVFKNSYQDIKRDQKYIPLGEGKTFYKREYFGSVDAKGDLKNYNYNAGHHGPNTSREDGNDFHADLFKSTDQVYGEFMQRRNSAKTVQDPFCLVPGGIGKALYGNVQRRVYW